ncbi:hypothetical protein F5I97DRAFT_1832729 [Phlebopus sp. FC_14]|nr:hypothetical protein F5I97DRAFT_1832729 [Phlebopus sp. FC_14]
MAQACSLSSRLSLQPSFCGIPMCVLSVPCFHSTMLIRRIVGTVKLDSKHSAPWRRNRDEADYGCIETLSARSPVDFISWFITGSDHEQVETDRDSKGLVGVRLEQVSLSNKDIKIVTRALQNTKQTSVTRVLHTQKGPSNSFPPKTLKLQGHYSAAATEFMAVLLVQHTPPHMPVALENS